MKGKSTTISGLASMKQRKTRDCGYQAAVFATLNLRKLAASCNSDLHPKMYKHHGQINPLTVHSQFCPNSLFSLKNQSNPDLSTRTHIIQAIQNQELFSCKRNRKITFSQRELRKPMDKQIVLWGVVAFPKHRDATWRKIVAFPKHRDTAWWKNNQFLIPSVTFSQRALLGDSLKKSVYSLQCERVACSRISVPTCHVNSAQINQIPLETPCMVHSLAFQAFWKWARIRLDGPVNTLSHKT